MSEGETPLTDKAQYMVRLGKHRRWVVRPELARDLERKLAEAKANEAAMSQISVNCQCPTKDMEIAILRGKLAVARTALQLIVGKNSMLRSYTAEEAASDAKQALARIDSKEAP